MTVDPENIKAVLATQFNDYGKGPEFYLGWYEVGNYLLPQLIQVLRERNIQCRWPRMV